MEKDWDRMLEIVLVPFTLLGLSVWIEAEMSSWQEDIAVTQMVDSYFDGITDILSSEGAELSHYAAIARSRALFFRLQELERKEEMINVLRYLSEASPDILRGSPFEQDQQASQYYIDFSYSNLSSSDIQIMELEDMIFISSNFEQSSFYNFSCEACSFTASSFRNADFLMVSLAGSDLTDVDFTGSNIGEVDLEGAILDYAKWSDGRVCVKGSIGICK
ncbi:pentapeptide repeat-containing protein [Shewanella sp. GutCb]|uniref:pentapeptide repeat-containing protein n=1 Tax=Shewanella sp. GutCb TaxID=2058315 RepID=UPI0015E14AEF|nr:pentapeptide repeat-containing protein [Shewanella sp. GutCb]